MIEEEKLAEEYRKSLWQRLTDDDDFERLEMFDENVEEAFLAGLEAGRLEAGRPKWHKVADGDLPPVNLTVLNEDCDKVIHYGKGKWEAYSEYYEDYIDIEPPVAWCEKPEYKEEQ